MRPATCLRLVSGVAVLSLLFGTLTAYGYIGLVGTPTVLDFFIRESFRADQVDDRSFRYDAEYFLNALSFRHLTDADRIWADHTTGYRLAMGSVSNDEFFLDHEVKVDAELGANVTFHYRFVQAEDYDSRFVRNVVGLSYHVSKLLGAYGFTQLNGLKKDIDAGGGLLMTTTPIRLNLGFVFPQAFLNMKSQAGERFTRQAFGLGLRTRLTLSPPWTLSIRLFHNFPLRLERPRQQVTFEFRRLVYGVSLEYRLDSRSTLRWGLDGEDTLKERRFSSSQSLNTARLTRFALRSTLVYSRNWPNGTLLDLGIWFQRFREPTRFPLAPARTIVRERTEVVLFGQLSLRLWKGLFVVPGVFVGPVEATAHRPDVALPDTGGHSIQAKTNLGLAYHFSNRAQLRLQPTFDLDQQRFGGAGPTLVVAF